MRTIAAASLLAGGLALPAQADETTYCNAYILSLPYTITQQGHYCFQRNLSTAATTGAAITINTDFVVLDLNNFKLGGGSAGAGSLAVGIESLDHKNITVRNGNIRGFYRGISLTQSAPGGSAGHLVENNLLDGNLHDGILVEGTGVVVRGNTVVNTGGSTFSNNVWSAIVANEERAVVRDNVVDGIVAGAYDTYGIRLDAGTSGVAERNVVQIGFSDAANVGIAAELCRDNSVFGGTVLCGYYAGDNFILP